MEGLAYGEFEKTNIFKSELNDLETQVSIERQNPPDYYRCETQSEYDTAIRQYEGLLEFKKRVTEFNENTDSDYAILDNYAKRRDTDKAKVVEVLRDYAPLFSYSSLADNFSYEGNRIEQTNGSFLKDHYNDEDFITKYFRETYATFKSKGNSFNTTGESYNQKNQEYLNSLRISSLIAFKVGSKGIISHVFGVIYTVKVRIGNPPIPLPPTGSSIPYASAGERRLPRLTGSQGRTTPGARPAKVPTKITQERPTPSTTESVETITITPQQIEVEKQNITRHRTGVFIEFGEVKHYYLKSSQGQEFIIPSQNKTAYELFKSDEFIQAWIEHKYSSSTPKADEKIFAFFLDYASGKGIDTGISPEDQSVMRGL